MEAEFEQRLTSCLKLIKEFFPSLHFLSFSGNDLENYIWWSFILHKIVQETYSDLSQANVWDAPESFWSAAEMYEGNYSVMSN